MTTALAQGEIADLVPLLSFEAATPIRRAAWSRDVTFGGNVYTADNFAFSELRQGIEGERPRVELSIQNVADVATGAAQPWTTYLGGTDLNGTEVVLRLVVLSVSASDATAVIAEERWYVSGWTWDRETARFGLGSPHDALALETPTKPLGSRTCGWNYQQGPCLSQATAAECPKLLVDCGVRFETDAKLPFGPSFPFLTSGARRRVG